MQSTNEDNGNAEIFRIILILNLRCTYIWDNRLREQKIIFTSFSEDFHAIAVSKI